MPRSPARKITVLHSREEIPLFANEEEEHQFWSTHSLGDEFWDAAEAIPDGFLPPTRPRPVSVTLRLDEETVQRAKALAARRHTDYRALLQDILKERLAGEAPAMPTGAGQ